jgi:predicted DNA-binding transcriptional regulator YafY
MPFNKDAYQRYKLIDARLRLKTKPAPTLQDLIDYVNSKNEDSVSLRTVQKDIQFMRQDQSLGFNAPIIYDRIKKSYSYTDLDFAIDKLSLSEEDIFGLDVALNILQQFKEIPAIKMFEDAILRMSTSVKKSKEDISSTNSMLLMDHPNKYAGVQYMQDIVDAIRNKTELQIMYQSFTKPEPKKHFLQPYFIKEYNGRLYLIANDISPGKMTKLLIFSFDRIKTLFSTTKKFKEEKIDKHNFFANTLGISNSDTKPEKIILIFDSSQANYLKTQVLHSSQEILQETATEIEIGLNLVVNYELKMLILGFGSKVVVKSPLGLKEFIKNEIEKSRAKYF